MKIAVNRSQVILVVASMLLLSACDKPQSPPSPPAVTCAPEIVVADMPKMDVPVVAVISPYRSAEVAGKPFRNEGKLHLNLSDDRSQLSVRFEFNAHEKVPPAKGGEEAIYHIMSTDTASFSFQLAVSATPGCKYQLLNGSNRIEEQFFSEMTGGQGQIPAGNLPYHYFSGGEVSLPSHVQFHLKPLKLRLVNAAGGGS